MNKTELKEAIAEVKEICDKYDYYDRVIMPYGYGIKIREFIKPWKEMRDNYGLKYGGSFLTREVTGLLKILHSWVKFEKEEKVTVKFVKGEQEGQTKEIQKSLADIFVQTEYAVLV